MKAFTQKYSSKVAGVLSCYDRLVITGTLPVLSNCHHLTSYMYEKGVRIFDYAKFAEPYREKLKENAEKTARESGIEIEFIRKSGVRKESVIEKKLKERGTGEGLVHILSVMEGCTTYKPWHDKTTHKTFFKIRPKQMPDLLLLFYRQPAGSMLCARAYLASLQTADLLQRPCLAGQ